MAKLVALGIAVLVVAVVVMLFLRLHRIGFVFQQMNMMENLNILDNILLPALQANKERKSGKSGRSGKKEKKELVDEAMGLMGKISISGLEQRRITEVSGGQLQRACICRSMMNHPEILFADEPTGALNKSATEEVMNALSALNREGTTILMVTHDSRMASRCGRILYLLDGQIQGELTLEDCQHNSLRQREEKVNRWLAEMEW